MTNLKEVDHYEMFKSLFVAQFKGKGTLLSRQPTNEGFAVKVKTAKAVTPEQIIKFLNESKIDFKRKGKAYNQPFTFDLTDLNNRCIENMFNLKKQASRTDLVNKSNAESGRAKETNTERPTEEGRTGDKFIERLDKDLYDFAGWAIQPGLTQKEILIHWAEICFPGKEVKINLNEANSRRPSAYSVKVFERYESGTDFEKKLLERHLAEEELVSFGIDQSTTGKFFIPGGGGNSPKTNYCFWFECRGDQSSPSPHTDPKPKSPKRESPDEPMTNSNPADDKSVVEQIVELLKSGGHLPFTRTLEDFSPEEILDHLSKNEPDTFKAILFGKIILSLQGVVREMVSQGYLSEEQIFGKKVYVPTDSL